MTQRDRNEVKPGRIRARNEDSDKKIFCSTDMTWHDGDNHCKGNSLRNGVAGVTSPTPTMTEIQPN